MLHKQEDEVEALRFLYNTMLKSKSNIEFLESMNADSK